MNINNINFINTTLFRYLFNITSPCNADAIDFSQKVNRHGHGVRKYRYYWS